MTDVPSPLRYAGFWPRFGSSWLDALVLLPLTGMVLYFGGNSRLFSLYWLLPSLLLGAWFNVYLVGRYGGTPGKRLLKLRIAMVDGSPVTRAAAVKRYVVLFLLTAFESAVLAAGYMTMTDAQFSSLGFTARSELISQMTAPWFTIGTVLTQIWIWGEFLTLLFNKERRAIHDFMAGTVVIHDPIAP